MILTFMFPAGRSETTDLNLNADVFSYWIEIVETLKIIWDPSARRWFTERQNEAC